MSSCGQLVHSREVQLVDNCNVIHMHFEKSLVGWLYTKVIRAATARFYTYIGGLSATIIDLVTDHGCCFSPLSTPLTVTTTCFVNKEGVV